MANPEGRDAERVPWRALTWLVILAVVAYRNFNAFRYPILFGDDGTQLFMFYLENRGPESLLREYAGYVSFAANSMGWLIGALPMVWQPYLLAANAGLIGVTSLWLFTSPRFAGLLPDTWVRCVICGCLAILPVGDFALMTCTMFVNWHLLLVACLLALAEPPRTRGGLLAEGGLVWLCLWTNPVGVVLVPVYLIRAWHTERPAHRLYYGVLAGAAVLYQLLFVTHGGSSEAFEAPVGSVLHAAWRLGSERVLTEPLVGSVGRFHLEQTGVPLVTYLPVVVVAMFLFVRSLHLSDPAKARLTAVGYLVVAMTLLIAFARFGWFEDMLHWGHRYTYVQKLLVYFGVAVAVFASGRRPVAWAVMLLLHVALLAWLDQRPYQVSRVRGERVMHFVRQAAAWRDDPGSVGEQMVYDEAARQLVIRRAPGDRPSSSPRRP